MRITPVPPHIIPPIHQADAALNQDNPVSGTQYTVLATARNVRVISMYAQCTWTVQPSPLELHLTIDGNAELFSVANPVSATWYLAEFRSDLGGTNALSTIAAPAPVNRSAFLCEGRSVLIQAETTGGTVSNLSARVKYGKW